MTASEFIERAFPDAFTNEEGIPFNFVQRSFKKGSVLTKYDRVENKVYFIQSGIILLNIRCDGEEQVIVYQTISTLFALIEHANITVHPGIDRAVQWVFVTPTFHKVHHSKLDADAGFNFGNILTLWDRIFGTLRTRRSYSDLRYGIDQIAEDKNLSFREMLLLPFGKPTYPGT